MNIFKRIFLFIERKIFGREILFKWMYKNSLQNNLTIIEIGSNDGNEAQIALNSKKNINLLIYEPDNNNFKKLKNLFNNRRKIKIYNYGISSKVGLKNFYFNKKYNNLNKVDLVKKDNLKYFIKKKIYFSKLDIEVKKNLIKKNLLIKMDVEGHEYEILKSSLKFLLKNKNISILMELHPSIYKGNLMKNLISKLFDNGYNIKFVESAETITPLEFKSDNYVPFKSSFQRGLYNDVSKKFLLKYAFDNSKKKIVRSVLLTNKMV